MKINIFQHQPKTKYSVCSETKYLKFGQNIFDKIELKKSSIVMFIAKSVLLQYEFTLIMSTLKKFILGILFFGKIFPCENSVIEGRKVLPV